MNNFYRAFYSLMTILALLVACSPSAATETAEAEEFTIGIIYPSDIFQPVADGLIAGMSELGYEEGVNITYVYAEITTEADLQPAAEAFVEQSVDLIFTATNGATEAALAATDTIPVVAGLVMHSVESGYADSLSQPGGNYTAVDIGPVTPRRFQLLIEMFPDIERVYIPVQTDYPPSEFGLAAIIPIAEELGIELVIERFTDPSAVEPAIHNIPEDVDAIFTLPDIFVSGDLNAWSEEAIARHIPHTHINQPQRGPLFTYGSEFYSNGFQSANLVNQILLGANPGELPIEIGEFFLHINLRTAEAAGIEIPDEFLNRANEIIRVEGD